MIYVCTTYATYGSHRCTQHKLFEDDIKEVVLADIRSLAEEARLDREALIARIAASTPDERKPSFSVEDALHCSRRLTEINKLLDKLYEDHVLGKVSDSNFNRMMG